MPDVASTLVCPLLFIFVLISPLIAYLVKRFKYIWLIVCFAAVLVHNDMPGRNLDGFLCRGLSLPGLFYFSAGIYIRQIKPIKTSNCIGTVSAALGLSLLVTKVILYFNGLPLQALCGKLSIPFLLIAVWHFMPDFQLPPFLANCSFPIYVMHMVFFPFINLAIKTVDISTPSFLPATIRLIASFSFAVVATNLLRHFLPSISRILFGGR